MPQVTLVTLVNKRFRSSPILPQGMWNHWLQGSEKEALTYSDYLWLYHAISSQRGNSPEARLHWLVFFYGQLAGASKAAPLNYEGCSEDGEKSNVCDLNYLAAQLELASELAICWGMQPSQAAPLWPPCQLCWRPLCRGVSWSLRESVAWVIQRSRWSVLLMARTAQLQTVKVGGELKLFHAEVWWEWRSLHS